MEAQNHILQELNDLKSSLPQLPHPYRAPEGYFTQLPEQVMLRIKTENLGAAEETAVLSTLLAGAGRKTPYAVPAGYFESLDLSWVWAEDESADKELSSLSSVWAGLKKESPFTVPEGYFDKKITALPGEEAEEPARVVRMSARGWFRYAAAAVVIGIIATTFLLVNGGKSIDPNEKSYAWVEKNLKKVETKAIDKFVALAPGEGNAATTVTVSAEVSSLLKNVSDHDMQEFLMATGNLDADPDDDELFLN